MPTPSLPPGFSYCQQIQVTNGAGVSVTGNPTTLGGTVASTSTDYVVTLHLTGAAVSSLYGQLQHAPSATVLDSTATADVGMFWWNGSAWTQIDLDILQVDFGVWSTANLALRFKLQATIAAGNSDSNYMLAWGNSAAQSQSWNGLYPFWDDFSGTTLNTTKWPTTVGTAPTSSVASSILTLTGNGNPSSIQEATSYGVSYRESVYAQMTQIDTTHLFYFEWRNGNTYPDSFGQLAYNETKYATQWHTANNPSGTYSTNPIPNLTADTGWHLFEQGRDASGNLFGAVDGNTYTWSGQTWTQADPFQLNVPAAGSVLKVNWIKVRPWMTTEPTVALTGSIITADPFPLAYNRPNQLIAQPIYSM